MNEKLEPVVKALKERFSPGEYRFRDQLSLILRADQIVEVVRTMRDEFGFDLLAELTAVDYWPQLEPRFQILYQVRSLGDNLILGLRVPLDGNSPSIPSITGVYEAANYFERELWDMFGIHVEAHPDLRRILMPEDWEGHPLRKDYPLGYEEVQFTFNFDEIDIRKPYAKE